MMLLRLVLISCFILFPLCCANKRALQPLDDFSLKSFLTLFREAMLDKVATQWNITIQQAEFLRHEMNKCDAKMLTRIDLCRNCTQQRCTVQPSFTGYLSTFDPVAALSGPLEEVGDGLSEAVLLLGTKSFTFLDAMGGITVEAGKTFGDGFLAVANEMANDFKKLPDVLEAGGQYTLDGLGDLGSLTVHGLTDVGSSIGDGFEAVGESIYSGLSSIFGRRRRMYDISSRECMNRCDDVCWHLMTDDHAQAISNVCGMYVVALNKTVHTSIEKTTLLYNATLDTNSPIVTKVELDTADIVPGTTTVNTVYITANVNGATARYRSSSPYNMMDVPSAARSAATELWQMWS